MEFVIGSMAMMIRIKIDYFCQEHLISFTRKKDFDWIQIVDVITEEQYRGRGYAPAILRIMLMDIRKRFPKGTNLFLLVDRENLTAIKIYLDLRFEIRFAIYNEGISYYVMTLSTQRSVKQLKSIKLLTLY